MWYPEHGDAPEQMKLPDLFTLLQKRVMFALIHLNEGFAGRTSMLQHSAAPTQDTSAGVQALQATSDTSLQSMMACVCHKPEELSSVQPRGQTREHNPKELEASFSVQVQLTRSLHATRRRA